MQVAVKIWWVAFIGPFKLIKMLYFILVLFKTKRLFKVKKNDESKNIIKRVLNDQSNDGGP